MCDSQVVNLPAGLNLFVPPLAARLDSSEYICDTILVDEVSMVVDKVPLLPVWFKHTKLIGDVLGGVC